MLGRVDCPCCGYDMGMRVTLDKNDEPFGYCEGRCNVQIRIGGSKYRVDLFYQRHPQLKPGGPGPVTVTVTDGNGNGNPGAAANPVTVTDGNGKGKEVKAKSYLEFLGVKVD